MENIRNLLHKLSMQLRKAKTSIISLSRGVICLVIMSIFSNSLAMDDRLSLKPIIDNLPNSWALEYSPSNTLFVTHRNGSVSEYSLDGTLILSVDLELSDLYVAGQGGLMDIAFHPNFTSNGWVYFSYSYGTDDSNGLKVIRAKIENNEAVNAITRKEDIFVQSDLRDTAAHYGARMAFLPDNTLLITTGDGFDYREQAQVLSSELGKVLRVTDSGEVPANNPTFSDNLDFPTKVFSLGHRNPQGLVVLPNGDIWANEHGPDGGDEVNRIIRANNYGWPVVTKGKDYIGSQISPFDNYSGMREPKYNWTPSIAPSAMAFYSATKFKVFEQRLLIPSLKYKQLHTLLITDDIVEDEQVMFSDYNYRLRDITISDTGDVFILSDKAPAKVFKVVMN